MTPTTIEFEAFYSYCADPISQRRRILQGRQQQSVVSCALESVFLGDPHIQYMPANHDITIWARCAIPSNESIQPSKIKLDRNRSRLDSFSQQSEAV